MGIRVCPHCNSAFYALPDNLYVCCPDCGFVLSDRRKKERFKRPLKLIFRSGNVVRRAVVTDYSEDGARIEYSGGALPVGLLLDVDIEELHIHGRARTVWTEKGRGAKKVTGLRLLGS